MKHVILSLTLLGALALPAIASAQTAGVINPSLVEWTAPITSQDGTPLVDLMGYSVRVAGPLADSTTPCPAFTPATYPVKATKASPTTTPAADTVVSVGTPGSKNLAGDLGLTIDGSYCAAVSATDLALNEGAASSTVPFSRNVIAPAAPSGSRVVQ